MLDIDIDDYAVPYRLANPNNEVNQIGIYPNPTTNILNIEIPDDFEQLSFELIDILGRETPCKKSTPLFYIYENGTVEKRIIIE